MSARLVILVQERTLGRGKHATAGVRKAVLMAMANKAADDGTKVFASQTTLAALADCSKRAIQFCLEDFETEKLIKRAGLRGQQIVWRLDLARIEKLPAAVKPANPIRQSDAPVTSKPANRIRRSTLGTSESDSLDQRIGFVETSESDSPNPVLEPVHEPKNPPTPLRGNGCGVSEGDEMPLFELTGGPKDDGFQAAWLMWPQKGRSDKRAAQAEWAELVKAHAPVMLKAAVEVYLNSEEAQRKRGQYIPAFERWLKKRVVAWIEIAKDPNKGATDGKRAANGVNGYTEASLRKGSRRGDMVRAALRRELRRKRADDEGNSGAGAAGHETGPRPGATPTRAGQ